MLSPFDRKEKQQTNRNERYCTVSFHPVVQIGISRETLQLPLTALGNPVIYGLPSFPPGFMLQKRVN